jgi:hypothetical protein
MGRSRWPHGLKCRAATRAYWDCGFEFRRRHGCLSVVSLVYCQVEVSATGRCLVQSSPGEGVCVSLSVIRGSNSPLQLIWEGRRVQTKKERKKGKERNLPNSLNTQTAATDQLSSTNLWNCCMSGGQLRGSGRPKLHSDIWMRLRWENHIYFYMCKCKYIHKDSLFTEFSNRAPHLEATCPVLIFQTM